MRKDYFWVRIRRKLRVNFKLTRGVLITFIAIFIGLSSYLVLRNVDFSGIRYGFGMARAFISPSASELFSTNGRINILILGKSTKDHAGSDLTDTILLSSISLNQKDLVLISIPRDVWISEIRAKINSAYYWGNQKKPGGGIFFAKTIVEEMVGQPIHYVAVIDFSGFKNVVDSLGGINVNVVNSFVDEKYPIAGKENDLCGGDKTYSCRYERIEFNKGVVYMDGDTALKFVRSRNASGDEGTDVARGARQQQIIEAVKNKVLSREILLNPKKLLGLATAVTQSIETDFDYKTGMSLARKVLDNRQGMKSYIVDSNFLIVPPISEKYDKQYVFIPKTGDWSELQKWIDSILN